jgi:hypothetical protein
VLLFFFLSIRIWIFFVLFLHILILCFISVVYSNCHVCNISQVWANKTSLTPVKVNGRVFVLGVSICLFLRFFQCDILFLYFIVFPHMALVLFCPLGLWFSYCSLTSVIVVFELLLYFLNVMFCSCFLILLFIRFSCFVYPVCDCMYCSLL